MKTWAEAFYDSSVLWQVVMICLSALVGHAAVTLSVSPNKQTISPGSPINVDLMVSGLGTRVGTFDINIAFDSKVLSFSGITFGNQLDVLGLGDVQVTSPSTGTVEIAEISLDSIADLTNHQASAFRLATLTFQTFAAGGNSALTLSVNALGDPSGASIAATLLNGSVVVGSSSLSKCDLNQDGSTNVADVQLSINEALGVSPALDDLNKDTLVNVADVQIAINAALGLGCAAQ